MFLLLLLRALTHFVPPFDEAAAHDPLVRWDAIHFLAIAKDGYTYEHNWAFFPALPAIIRSAGLLPTSALITCISLDGLRILFELSTEVLGSSSLARIVTILALLPSSPIPLFLVPYNEPFFTYLSYRGMLYSSRSQWLKAAVSFALASCFRSNGIFLAGFIIWGLLIEKRPTPTSFIYAATLSALVFAPFVYHNYTGYATFCLGITSNHPAWCQTRFPLIYTHVQVKYWNTGLFKYWTLQQLPNFLLAAPPLALIYTFGIWHLQAAIRRSESPFASLKLTPHVLHALFTATILLFASHTQITLRLAAAMPTLYWGATWLWTDPSHVFWAKAWVYWSAMWGAISLVLWTAFLPPA